MFSNFSPKQDIPAEQVVAPVEPPKSDRKQWKIKAFEIGDWKSCLFSFVCPCLAIGQAREILDGSEWVVSCFCMNPSAMRWITRTAYDIEGTAQYDCWYGLLCPCCAANQIYQTIAHYGKVSEYGRIGPQYNTRPRYGLLHTERDFNSFCYDITYACFCPCLANGYVMMSVGMPFWFGACCVQSYTANTIIRYHHKYQPWWETELIPDILVPVLSSLCGFTAYISCWLYSAGMLIETNVDNGTRNDIPYGLDLSAFADYQYEYFSRNCTCTEPETGRYLDKKWDI